MEPKKQALYVASAVAAAAIAAGSCAPRPGTQSPARIEAHLNTWYDSPRRAAETLIDRYGPPDEIAPALATWRERGLFKRIAVHGDSPDTYLEHTVGYRVPPAALEALNLFGHGVRFNAEDEELSARSNVDSLNFLALNLADEVVKGERSPEDADDFYLKAARLELSGKAAGYMQNLRFQPYRPRP